MEVTVDANTDAECTCRKPAQVRGARNSTAVRRPRTARLHMHKLVIICIC